MPSVIALRALLGAGLGLGALDLVWINTALAPRLVHREPPPARVAMTTSPASVPPPAEPAPPAPIPAAVESPPANEPSPRQETTITERVYFETSSAALDVRARTALARLAASAQPNAIFALEGHADFRGTEARNKTLSKERAVAVQHQLMRLGIDRTRIHVAFVGEDQPGGKLWRDRRVEIQITGGTR
jgi:peptidoglycan-associated lipoprotein